MLIQGFELVGIERILLLWPYRINNDTGGRNALQNSWFGSGLGRMRADGRVRQHDDRKDG